MKSEDEKGAGLLAEKLKLRLYGAARLLCAALIVNAVCLFTLVSFRYLSVPALVALAAIALGLAFPRRPKGRWQRLRESVVCTVAVLHLLLVGLWLHFVVGWFGIGINSRFLAMVEDADRVVIRDGGGLCHSDPDREPSICEITDKAEIAEFNAMFRFSGTRLPCMCCGYPGIDWWRDGKRIAVSALHHGTALRIEGKGCDWRLTPDSSFRIVKWIKDRCNLDPDSTRLFMNCSLARRELAAAADSWSAQNGGRRPTMDDLRAHFTGKGEPFPSCPLGGVYSLSLGKDGLHRAACSKHLPGKVKGTLGVGPL